MDTKHADLLQINETDNHKANDESKLTKMRSLIDNMQLQIQLAIKSGAKVWPDLYQAPDLMAKLAAKTIHTLPSSRQRLILRFLLALTYCLKLLKTLL